MKYFGFIKEHDDSEFATSIKDLIIEGNEENSNRLEVLDFLRRGELCVAWMGCVENANDPNFRKDNYDDDDFIAYSAIDTDGKWYWPEYIITYLEKYPTMKIDDKFVDYVIKNKKKEIKLSQDEISKLEKEYLKKTGS